MDDFTHNPGNNSLNDAGGKRSPGQITQVIGPVVDVEFPVDAMPDIYNALTVDIADPANDGETKTLTLEVAQHLGEGLVRTIALEPNDGLVRQAVVTNSGAGI